MPQKCSLKSSLVHNIKNILYYNFSSVKTCYVLEVSNGMVRYSGVGLPIPVKTVAIVQCRPLYKLKGTGVRTCEAKGWSGTSSICERKTNKFVYL